MLFSKPVSFLHLIECVYWELNASLVKPAFSISFRYGDFAHRIDPHRSSSDQQRDFGVPLV
jgi:hypothetical protein